MTKKRMMCVGEGKRGKRNETGIMSLQLKEYICKGKNKKDEERLIHKKGMKEGKRERN